MGELYRFGISMEKTLSREFDCYIKSKKYSNRSEAIRDLIREKLSRDKIKDKKADVIGTINITYDHHKRELDRQITSIQHDFHHIVKSSLHYHIDHDRCLEIILVEGKLGKVRELADLLFAEKGVFLGDLFIIPMKK